jgi:hypothetical protein
MPDDLSRDLKILRDSPFEWRLSNGEALVRRYHAARLKVEAHADAALIGKAYRWFLAPVTLWPIPIQSLCERALHYAERATALPPTFRLMVELLPDPPDAKASLAHQTHERQTATGDYGVMVRAKHKLDSMEQEIAEDPAFRAHWREIKRRFPVARHRDRRGIIRRPPMQERGYRPVFTRGTNASAFHVAFTAFCHRWHLYGMKGDRPLVLRLSVNATPFGTMLFIPSFWSLDPKRDLNWAEIARLHRSRGLPRQGEKLSSNRRERLAQAKRARKLWDETTAAGLRGDRRNQEVMAKLGWDPRTDEKTLRRLLKEAPSQ